MQQSQFILVADIGGTNGRFALASRQMGKICLDHQHTLPSNGAASLLSLTQNYLTLLPSGIDIMGASMAVAGPVTDDGANLTNLGWQVSAKELQTQLSVSNFMLLNDFAAYANSIPLLDAADIQQIKLGREVASAPVLVLGPGTGFGIAALHPQGAGFKPVACEGGHMALAAQNELQDAVIRQLRHIDDFVSVETILCGPGLVNLYRALALVRGEAPILESAAQISQAALADQDELAYETLALFCRWLGQVVGDLVMAHGALGGVMLGGGILPRMAEFLRASEFMLGMLDKGRMSAYLEDVPVSLAMKSDTALTGAAAWWYQNA